MTIEQLEKGNKIVKEIEVCKRNIKIASYTQVEEVLIRESKLSANGFGEPLLVPESLFRVIGKLVLAEYNQRLIELENELRNL